MQQRFLLQILLLAQHVSGTTMPIIRSSRVLYSSCCLWYRAVVFKLLVWCGAEGYVSGLQDAAASCKPDTFIAESHYNPANRTHSLQNHIIIPKCAISIQHIRT